MTTWKAYAEITPHNRDILLYVSRPLTGSKEHRVTEISTAGTVVKQVTATPENIYPAYDLKVNTEVAEALYQALDRIFGKLQDDPQTLQDALNHERARVDRVLTHFLKGNE